MLGRGRLGVWAPRLITFIGLRYGKERQVIFTVVDSLA